MEKFQTVTSIVAPFPLKDVDTDVIYPAHYLTSTDRQGLGKYLFERLRSDPSFVLNQDRYKHAQILLVGENFGCGSSREHAVWSLMDAGFKAIIGTTFPDIFSANSAKNGLLLVKLQSEEFAEIVNSAKATLTVTVDLNAQTVTLSNGKSFGFPYDEFRKSCLLEGKDDLDYLLSFHSEIVAHFANKKALRL